MLCVDDQHHVDVESANALRFALDRLTHEPVGTLVTARMTGRDEPSMLDDRHSDQIELDPLPLTDLRGVLAHAFPTVSRPDLLRAHELSGGNPTAALTLLRSWGRDRRGYPPVVEDNALAAQLRALPPESVALVQTLAVAGPTPAGLLAAAAGVDFERAARPVLAAGVIHVADDLTVRFAHTLYANVVRAGIDPLDGHAIHGRLAVLVRSPEDAARHLAAATVLPDASIAARLEAIAGQGARRGAAASAAELMAGAVRLTPPADDDAAARRALREVVHRAAAGESARAMSLAARLLASLPSGPQRAEALTLRVFLDFGDSERFLRQALDEIGPDPALRARILDLLGWQLGLYRGRLAEGIAVTKAAIAQYLELGEPAAGCAAKASLAAQLSLNGQPSPELFDDAIASADAMSPFALGRWPRVFRARTMLWAGDLEGARRDLLRAQKDAEVLGSEFQRPYRLCDLAILDVAAGDLDSATVRAEEGISAARDAGNEQAIAWLTYPLGLAAALQGGSQRADQAADLLIRWGQTHDEPPRLLMADEIRGSLSASAGDWPRALDHFTAMAQQLDEMGFAHPGAWPALPRAVEAAAMSDNHAVCARLTDRLVRQAAAVSLPLTDAHATAAQGHFALIDGDTERAVRRLDDAVGAYLRCGHRLDAARSGLALARAWLRCGQRAHARAAADAARGRFAAARVPDGVAAAGELLARAGAGHSDRPLTPTEERIATLVAAGRLNREIAAELFISVSTVEAHLTRIYRKLRLRHRTELTTYLHTNTLDQGP